ncbi:MAG: 23S rRNA (uracil(1939)-C(5))-methyltransferase RlmD [Christensenellales bacterium]
MIKKNDIIAAQIENYGCNGEGVAKVDGQIVFLPYTLKGEKLTATIIYDKKNFLIAKPNNIYAQSKFRTTPPCPYFAKCGGCQLQHACYEHTLTIKQNIVQDAISKIGKINFKVLPCVASDMTYNYRNKFAMPCNPATRQLGMYRTNSHSIVDVEKCILQKSQINKLITVFNQYLKTTKTSIYDEHTKSGALKHLVAREIDDKLLITVVINADHLKDVNTLVELLKQNFDKFGLNLNINKLNNNVILSNKFINVYGLEQIDITENNISYSITNQSFLQVNNHIKNKIYDAVFDEIKNGVVIDAYSGAGLLSAMISKHAQKVYGIEIVKPATTSANLLKQKNHIENLTNINGDCAKVLPELLEKLSVQDKQNLTVILDPPRKGCDKKVLQSILTAKPKKIIYISCSPSTLARDLNILTDEKEYKIQKIQPFDMFPQTKHVETLAILNYVNKI